MWVIWAVVKVAKQLTPIHLERYFCSKLEVNPSRHIISLAFIYLDFIILIFNSENLQKLLSELFSIVFVHFYPNIFTEK